MRKIKFRAWNGNEFYAPILSEGLIYRDCVDFQNFKNADDVLMQYTGLKDRNGKEIYEGDIVRVSDEYGGYAYSPMIVDFKDCCFVLRRSTYMADYNPMFKYDFNQVHEVIGNIYENEDLIK